MQQQQLTSPRWYLGARCFVFGVALTAIALLGDGPNPLREGIVLGSVLALGVLQLLLKFQRRRVHKRDLRGTRAAA